MATTAPSCTPLMSWMPGSSTTASKIGESPVEGLKKMYLTPAALSCATNKAPPVPVISRAAPAPAAAAAGAAAGAKFCAITLAATALIPIVVSPEMSLRREIPLSRYCLISSFTVSSSGVLVGGPDPALGTSLAWHKPGLAQAWLGTSLAWHKPGLAQAWLGTSL